MVYGRDNIEKKEINIRPRSYYKVAGGEHLTRISASWFVSYMYCLKEDKTHSNWENVSDPINRASRCDNNRAYHKIWINEIVGMNPKQLQRNKIGLTGQEVLDMAKIVKPFI